MFQKMISAATRWRSHAKPVIRSLDRPLLVLYLQDEVLIIYDENFSTGSEQTYQQEARQLLKKVFRYHNFCSEFYQLVPFQIERTNWKPIYANWKSMCLNRSLLEEQTNHGCYVNSILWHDLETPLLERLPKEVRNFIEKLRVARAVA